MNQSAEMVKIAAKALEDKKAEDTVSYTHLTLPTKQRV